MGLRDYRGYEQVKPQVKEPDIKTRQKSKKRYLRKMAIRKRNADKKIKNSVLMVAVLIFGSGTFLVTRDMSIYKAKSEITKLQGEVNLLREKNEDLKIKSSRNSSLEKIEKQAKERLGMIKPEEEDIVDFNNPLKPQDEVTIPSN